MAHEAPAAEAAAATAVSAAAAIAAAPTVGDPPAPPSLLVSPYRTATPNSLNGGALRQPLRLSRTASTALRLQPGQELVAALCGAVCRLRRRAAFVQTCVGSARVAVLRLAGATAATRNRVSPWLCTIEPHGTRWLGAQHRRNARDSVIHYLAVGLRSFCANTFRVSFFNHRSPPSSPSTSSNPQTIELREPLEIVSLTGTLACVAAEDDVEPQCAKHLHISLADSKGRVVGGHLVRLEVETTAEIVLGELEDAVFTREHDPATGFSELVVGRK